MLLRAWSTWCRSQFGSFSASKRMPRFQVRNRGWRVSQVEALEVRLLLSGADAEALNYDFGVWTSSASEDQGDDDHEHATAGGETRDLPAEGTGGSSGGSGGSGAGSPNITIIGAYLVDAFNQPITAPVIGETVFIHVDWTTVDLTTSDSYVARYTVDGVTLDGGVVTGSAGSATWYWYRGGWFATAGNHNVTVRVDGANTVSEVNENDNQLTFSFATAQPTTLPMKFASPLGGDEFEDWAVINYIDVDPRPGTAADYTGGVFQYDQHNGWDISLPNFERMDSGVPVLAAAGGVVASRQDGYFDRETSAQGQPWNVVTIDHGNGWQTVYGHLAKDTITVVTGETVTAGQILAFAGSSGNSTGAHLHFMVLHNGAVVETNFAPNTYWLTPWEYQRDRDVTVLDFGTANYNPFNSPNVDFQERTTEKTNFSRTSDNGGQLWFWFTTSHLLPTTTTSVRYVRPDGQVAVAVPVSTTNVDRGRTYGVFVTGSWQQMTGTWHIDLLIDGQLLATRDVLVTDTAAVPELRVRDGNALIVDDRTSAIPITSVASKSFTIQNYGGSTLTIDGIDVPPGFAIAGAAPTSVAPNGSATFSVQFNATAPDTYIGDVIIRSNDNDNSSYNFRVTGTITGTPVAGSPLETLQYHAVVDLPGGSATFLDPAATYSDADAPATAASYKLNVELVSGAFPGDIVKIVDGPVYTISGTDVLRNATVIGTIGAFSPTKFVIIFNTNGRQNDIQELIRAITFNAGGGTQSSGQRVVSILVTDQSGKTSQYGYRTVLVPEFVNSAPVLNDQTFQVPENSLVGTVVGTLVVTDDPGQSHTYTINSGNFLNAFSISPAGVITVTNPTVLNFESRPVFTLQVNVTDDGLPPLSDSATITIQLQDMNESPGSLLLTTTSVAENLPIGTTVAFMSNTDPDVSDTFTHTLVSGTGSADNALFSIVGNQLRTAAVFDFETDNSYQIRLRVTDQGGLFSERAVVIDITDVNDPPTVALQNTVPSLPENTNTLAAVRVADIVVSDDALGTNFLTLAGADAAVFEIVGGALRLRAGTVLNFNTQSSYSVTVQVDDSSVGATPDASVVFVLTITDSPVTVAVQNIVPSLLENTDTTAAIRVADIVVTDVGVGTNTLSLSGPHAAFFEIVGNELRLRAGTVLNFESRASYFVVIEVDNSSIVGAPEHVAGYTLQVTNVNEVPGIHLQNAQTTLPETTPSVLAVTVAEVVIDDDALGTNVLTLLGPDAAVFEIVGGDLRIKAGTPLNFETKSTYQVTIQVDDATLGGTPNASVNYTLTLIDINDAPTVALQNAIITLPENTSTGAGLKVADIVVTDDALGTSVLSLTGTDAAQFEIVGNELRLKSGVSLNFETKSSYSVLINVDDATVGVSPDATVSYSLSLTNVNETPTDLALSSSSIPENNVANGTVGLLVVTDPDAGNTFTFALVAGAGSTDNASFTITGSTLKITPVTNFEVKNSYDIRVRATDQGGLTFERPFTISITNVNEAPTDLALSAMTVTENNPLNTVIGILSGADPDAASTLTFSLAGGSSTADNASFLIAGNSLRINTVADFETKSNYTVRVRMTDQGGLFVEKAFVISVIDVNEAPTNIVLSPTSLVENNAPNATVGTFAGTDPDAGGTLTFSLISGAGSTDNNSFTLIGNTLRINDSADFETQSSYSIRVQATDQSGLTFERQFIISIVNANEAPTNIALSGTTVVENNAPDVVVGALSASDPDASNTFTFSLVPGAGSTDNASFTLTGNILTINNSADFETQSSYAIRVRTTDQGGLSFDQQFIISITNVNEAPTDIALSATSIVENNAPNAVVGTLIGIDPDAGGSFAFSLVAGAGSTDNGSFTVVGNTLRIVSSANFEAKASYDIRVHGMDQGGLSIEKSFTIAITNANEAPTDFVLSTTSLAENNAPNAAIGTFSASDPDAGGSFTYSLVSGAGSADNSNFLVAGNTLVIKTSANFEAQNSYSVRLRVRDQGGLTFEKAFSITVTDANDAPVDLVLSSLSFAENTPLQSVLGTLTAFDPDLANTFTFNLVGGIGSEDNGRFLVNGNTLQVNTHADFEAQSSYSIRLRATDQGGLTYEEPVTITVTNVNESPTIIGINAAQSVREDTPTDNLNFLVSDPETPAGNLMLSATSSNPQLLPVENIAFGGTGTNRSLVVTPATNQNGTGTITVTVSDGVFTRNQTFHVAVRDVDDPAEIVLRSAPLDYNASAKTSTTIDGAATISDRDTAPLKFAGAILTVSGQAGKDILSILSQNGISRRGLDVLFGGKVIGTVSGGTNGAALTVLLNGAATQDSVQRLLRSIGFKAAKKSFGTRTLQFQITNIGGLNTNIASRQIDV